jgi:hypothetical protein
MTRALPVIGICILLPVAVSWSAGRAERTGPPPTAPTAAPVVDGVVNPGEYTFTRDSGDFSLFARRTADTLYLAVKGATTGWAAVGVGALQMDGATIFMGYVDDTGAESFKPQAGMPGHTHEDTPDAVLKTVRAHALTEKDGITTLEVALTVDAYMTATADSLPVIYAIGPDDSFSEYHLEREFTTVPLPVTKAP